MFEIKVIALTALTEPPNALRCADGYGILYYLLRDLVTGESGCETRAVNGEIDGYIG